MMALLGLVIASGIVGFVSLIFSILAFAWVIGMKNSTHKIQYVDPLSDYKNNEEDYFRQHDYKYTNPDYKSTKDLAKDMAGYEKENDEIQDLPGILKKDKEV